MTLVWYGVVWYQEAGGISYQRRQGGGAAEDTVTFTSTPAVGKDVLSMLDHFERRYLTG